MVTTSCNSFRLPAELRADEADALDLALDARIDFLNHMIDTDAAPSVTFWRDQLGAARRVQAVLSATMVPA